MDKENKTKEFFDVPFAEENGFIACGDTLLMYNSNYGSTKKMRSFVIPSKVGECKIRRINSLCLEGLEIDDLYVPATINHISYGFFTSCKIKRIHLYSCTFNKQDSIVNKYNVEEVIIDDVELDKQQYNQILKNSMLDKNTNERVLTIIPRFLPIVDEDNWDKPIFNAKNTSTLGCDVSKYVKYLCLLKNPSINDMTNMFKKGTVKTYSLGGAIINPSENDIALDSPATLESFYERETYCINDDSDRYQNPIRPEIFYLPVIDENLTRFVGDKTIVTLKYVNGWFFFPSKQIVKYNNSEYFVYQRQYLTSYGMECRGDTGIYKGNELVKSKSEAMKVFEKYQLLTML